MSWDVIVGGLGAMGSAVACELAARGARVIGFDRGTPPHDRGSSHGESRIIREAYFEHPLYVPLVQRAYERWTRLAHEDGEPLLRATGGLMIGPRHGRLVDGALQSARRHGLAHEILTPAEMARRHPALQAAEDMVAVWEPRAAVLFPERCIAAHLRGARRHGAEIRVDEPILSWRATPRGVEVTTRAGVVSGGALVLACGAWMAQAAALPALPLVVERTVLHWFSAGPAAPLFAADRLPVFLLEYAPGRIIYGMPELPEVGAGIKVARHHEGETTTAEDLRREVTQAEIDAMAPLLAAYAPALCGGWLRSAVCMYTNTPDEHFLIDRHPAHRHVWLLSPCSGHGFKFASAIGELTADLVITGHCDFDVSPFAMGRLRPMS